VNNPAPGSGIVVVRRSYPVVVGDQPGVVVEIDATGEPRALAVQQAGLHPLAPGHRLGYGYDVTPWGLGAWVGDRRVQLRVWPVEADGHGDIVEEADPDDPDSEVLVLHFHPEVDRDALVQLVETGRLFVAGPDAGPVPLVLDLDRDLVAEVVAQVSPHP
jgi:hypothetical protein